MAAYEEAIFRVYDRSLEGVRQDNEEIDDGSISRKTCQTMEMVLLGGAAVISLFTFILHCTVVGRAGCLPELLNERMLKDNRSSLLPEDGILQINVPDRFYDSNDPFNPNGDVFDHSDDDITIEDRRRRRLLRWEELDTITKFQKQISEYESHRMHKFDKVRQWFRFRQPFVLKLAGYFKNAWGRSATDIPSAELGRQEAPANLQRGSHRHHYHRRLKQQNGAQGGEGDHKAQNTTAVGGNRTSDDEERFDPRYFQKHDFEYSADIGVLSLSDKIRAKHNFTLVEVSMEGEQCFGNGFLQSLIPFGSIDNLVLNNVMYTLHKKGILVSSRNDYYEWHEDVLHPYFNAGTWLGFKVTVAIKTLFSYFLLSSSTALLVRVLISSGVALIFPIFSFLDYTGIYGFTDQHLRLVSHAYPWLGMPMEMLAARRESQVPFVVAHISRVVLFYTLYEALQFAISIWFYEDNQPGEKELWLFALMMVWEYYSMVYVRTYSSIVLFPRGTFSAFALYHIYLYSFPGGYHFLVLFIMFLLTVWLMLFCIRKYEHDAYQRGVVNADQPRQLYNHLPYPTWTHALAPDYSLFQPPSHRSTSIYAEPVGGYGSNNNSSSETGAGASTGAGVRDADNENSAATSAEEVGDSHVDGAIASSVEMSNTSAWPSFLGLQPSSSNGRNTSYEQLDGNSSHHSNSETGSGPASSN